MKILAIGNSFSQDATAWLEQIALSSGKSAMVRNVFYPGCSLKEHCEFFERGNRAYDYECNAQSLDYRKYSLDEILKKEPWDIITFQQNSANAGTIESYEPYLTQLMQNVRDFCPNSKFWLHRIWAYDYNCEWNEFNNYGRNRDEMFEKIYYATEHIAAKHQLSIIPVGDYIQSARKLEIFDTDNGEPLYRDRAHLSFGAGRYLAGLIWFRYVLHGEMNNVSFIPSGISPKIAKHLISIASQELNK